MWLNQRKKRKIRRQQLLCAHIIIFINANFMCKFIWVCIFEIIVRILVLSSFQKLNLNINIDSHTPTYIDLIVNAFVRETLCLKATNLYTFYKMTCVCVSCDSECVRVSIQFFPLCLSYGHNLDFVTLVCLVTWKRLYFPTKAFANTYAHISHASEQVYTRTYIDISITVIDI